MIAFVAFYLMQLVGSLPFDPHADLTERFQYNVWERVAQTATVSNFCLSSKLTPDEMLGSCIIPVCHNQDNMLDPNSTAYIDYSVYARWGNQTTQLPKHSMDIMSPQVGSHDDICVRFKGCTTKCLAPRGQTLSCKHFQFIYAYPKYVMLPLGWFFTCGTRTYNYVPPNLAEGISCCLSRLTIVLPTHEMITADFSNRTTRSLHTLPESCNPNVTLLSPATYISMAVRLVGVPGLAVSNTKQIGKLACWAVKAINQTSTAIALLNQEQRELRGAILSNRAAIHYLFLKHHVGCAAVRQMCCFNLTDNYPAIETHWHNLHDLVQEVKVNDGISLHGIWSKIWDAMWSWLPDFGAGFRWIKNVLITVLIIVILLMGLCCCIQCMPGICGMLKAFKINWHRTDKWGPPPPYILTMPVLTYPEQNLYKHKQNVWGPEVQPLTDE